eukprot:Hpha_TRINITY_DN30124_c0_g1::TRINITY_DN30124_c0_g1_i1::g.110746::m.110746
MPPKQRAPKRLMCMVCKEDVGVQAHYIKCVNQLLTPDPSSNVFVLKITVKPGTEVGSDECTKFCLVVAMNGSGLLSDLDEFLRDIWMSCCDSYHHLSSFTECIPGLRSKVADFYKARRQQRRNQADGAAPLPAPLPVPRGPRCYDADWDRERGNYAKRPRARFMLKLRREKKERRERRRQAE